MLSIDFNFKVPKDTRDIYEASEQLINSCGGWKEIKKQLDLNQEAHDKNLNKIIEKFVKSSEGKEFLFKMLVRRASHRDNMDLS